jgi:hypothetical protein
LVIIVPMLGRAHHVGPLLGSIRATTPDARVVFVCTPGDHAVLGAIDREGAQRLVVAYSPIGDYARKINAGYGHTTEPHLFLGASDLRFHHGWYEAARARLDHNVGVVGTNDLGSPRVMAGDHSTHSLVTRAYADEWGTIDQPGKILCELYWHEYVDDEFVETAKLRGMFVSAPDSVVEHLHPNWGKGETDPTYAAQRVRMTRGIRTYQRRRHLWM